MELSENLDLKPNHVSNTTWEQTSMLIYQWKINSELASNKKKLIMRTEQLKSMWRNPVLIYTFCDSSR